MIPITKPFLPPRKEYKSLINDVWKRNRLTNNGPLVQNLEEELCNYLDVPYIKYVSSGTIALQIAIKALKLKGEIITTPFSHVSTTSSIVWEDCKPVYADINPETLNIDPTNIEPLITGETSAILATHVFGNPCNMKAIKTIADKYNLKVIYDGAHSFGTRYNGESVYNFGDISTASFHATKLFQTVEGGAVITRSAELNERISKMRNFGHAGFGNYEGLGINGKSGEFRAAMGLCNLQYIEDVLTVRKNQYEKYDSLLKQTGIKHQKIQADTTYYNCAFYPVVFESEKTTIATKRALEALDIYPRRYFYPSLNKLDYAGKQSAPVSESISKRILCLPLYYELADDEITQICEVIAGNKSIAS